MKSSKAKIFQLENFTVEQLARHWICQALYLTELVSVRQDSVLRIEPENSRSQNLLLFCAAGSGWLEHEESRQELKSGRVVIVPADTPLACFSDSGLPLELLWVRFAGGDSDYYVRALGHAARALVLNAKTSARITDLFRQMFEAVEARDSNHCGQLIHASHLLRLLLSHLLCNTGASQASQPHHPAVESAFAFMQSHVDSVLTLTDIARRAGLSVSHFCSVFRDQTGQTPMDYFIRMKIRKAQHLLVNSALTVQEIAQQVGYEDRYYFSRLFRKLLGVPPVEYRKLQRIEHY